MKRFLLLVGFPMMILSVMTSCIGVSHISSTSGLDEESLKGIPPKAKVIYVERKDTSIDNYYEEVISILMSRGHRIMREDKERHYITTEGKDVGESTLQRMTLLITENNSICILKITTEWKAGAEAAGMASAMGGMSIQPEWATASWEINRLGIAFAESFAIAKAIKDGIILYE
jgi:hypothetical protein